MPLLILLGRLSKGTLGAIGCIGVLLLGVFLIAISVYLNGLFWGDLVYNILLHHPFRHHRLTVDEWLIVGVAITVLVG